MRVLMTTDAVGGVWQYSVDLACGLAARGVEPVLALLGPGPDAGQRATLAARDVRLIETGLPLDWLCNGPAPALAAAARVTELAADLQADVLHLNAPTLAAAGPAALPTVAVAHGCVSTWWEAARPGEPIDPQLEWHQVLSARGLNSASRVVAPSASHGWAVARRYRLARLPHVVHNGRRALDDGASPGSCDDVLTAGRLWDPVKRTTLLDQAAARLAVPFHAAGPLRGPNGEAVACEHLHPLGVLDEVALGAKLASRPVFVSAASFEPFGLAVLEAAQAGCALVLSDVATFRELWEGAAILVPGDDPAAYADAIDRVIGNASLRHWLGEAARARAARYSVSAMTAGMMAVYGEVTGATVMPTGRVAA